MQQLLLLHIRLLKRTTSPNLRSTERERQRRSIYLSRASKNQKKMGGLRRSNTGLASLMVVAAAAAAMVLMISSTAEAQSVSCAQDLIPCANYLNSTNPPSSCCDPLKKTVENELTCLCNVFYSPGLLESFNINVTQALELSRRCGVTSDLSNCKQAGSAPAPSTGAPPAAQGGGDNKGAARRVSFTGFSSFLLLLGTSMFFN